MKSLALLIAGIGLGLGTYGCSSGNPTPQQMGNTSGSSQGQGSGSTGGATGTANGAGTGAIPSSGTVATTGATASGSGTTVPSSGTVVATSGGTSGVASGGGSGSTTSTGASAGAESGTTSGATTGTGGGGTGATSGSILGDGGPVTLPPGAVHDIPAGYAGMPFMGKMGVIPGTIYARNYDTGGQGVGFNHPGGTTCGDWPGGMPMYRLGADCVGLSVENAQKPDVLVDGGPADYGEIYISYCAPGEWLKYTVEVAESGTYAVSVNEGGPNVSISLAFSATPVVTTGTVMIPDSVDQAQPGHEMYHVWQNVDDFGMVTLEAGIYVMQFTIVTSQANFDSFNFTKM
jgi:hypothetical protein